MTFDSPAQAEPISKRDELRYGPLGEHCIHICVDMQRLFAEPTEWQMPWMEKILPTVVKLTLSAVPQTRHTTR